LKPIIEHDRPGAVAQPAMAVPPAMKRAWDLCVRKTRGNIQRLADEPKSGAFSVHGDYFSFGEGFFDIGNWTSSFFTGMALLAWRGTRDDHFLRQVERLAPLYRAKVMEHHTDTMHDLGFLYSLYSVALHKLTGNTRHREVALRAADVLRDRFDSRGGYLRAWGRMDEHDTDYAGLAIIDCLMNLPLLYWASEESGDPAFRDTATRHADTTLKYFVRADDSVFHAYRFEPGTGQPVGGDNYCGCAVDSHWARGTAWAVYGLALSSRYTGDSRYLEVSLRLARSFLQQLDQECVPLWDFRLPSGEEPLRDSSAAAIAVCGFQELLALKSVDARIAAGKRDILLRLCREDYLDFDDTCPGLLRHGQVGDGVGKARNAYTSWGDYYLMEALSRELEGGQTFW
jgi:unsaturated chondroitin disaccharide hydrolase